MFVKFKNGAKKKCTNPIEQKLFRSGNAAGWLCSFSISETVTSTELDELLTAENLVYLTDNCGEVVLDKLFIKELTKQYPNLKIKVLFYRTE